MYCKKCKNVIKDNEYYCPYCGYNNKKGEEIKNDNEITIKKCITNFFVNSFNASGVATRKEFWLIYLFFLVITITLSLVNLNYIGVIINIIFFFPIMCLTIRRYHDTNKSGAFAILGAYFKTGYLFSFFTSNTTIKYILIVSSVIALIIELILLSYPTNENSKWNPVNGYLD